MSITKKIIYLLLFSYLIIILNSFENDRSVEFEANAIADYMACLNQSKTIEINGVDVEMTEGNMIAICRGKNDSYGKTDHYKNNHQSYKDKVCVNRKPFNRDVLQSEDHATYQRSYSSGLTIPAIHDRNAFFTMYNAKQRKAYWFENYRSSGESSICNITIDGKFEDAYKEEINDLLEEMKS
ncbi:hypothetical protein N9840_00885 [Gammaproteobacteria bacterium]|nr:hypothetical protein [Gammaproteobacteria bacterium]